MDLYKQGTEALSASKPLEALSCFTRALIQHPTSPDYYVSRSTAFNRVSKHESALRDAEYALHFAHQRAKRDKMQAAQMRRAITLYHLVRYADAKVVLGYVKPWIKEDNKKGQMEVNMWEKKIDSKLEAVESDDEVAEAQEFPETRMPKEKEMVSELKAHLKPDGTYDFEGTQSAEQPAVEATPSHPPASTATPSATTHPTPAPTTIRHEFYQSAATITLTLYVKNVKSDTAEIELTPTTLAISFPHPSNSTSTFSFTLDPLYAEIVPDDSTYKIMSTKIEFTLKKKIVGPQWKALESAEPPTTSTSTDISTKERNDTVKTTLAPTLHQPTDAGKAPAYPTSSKKGPKDWDKVASDLTKKKPTPTPHSHKPEDDNPKPSEDSASDKDDGDDKDNDNDILLDDDDEYGDEVDGFFKKLYRGADDDTRRAMMKSFYESNGTTLSTNWAEVGSKRVDEYQSKDDGEK